MGLGSDLQLAKERIKALELEVSERKRRFRRVQLRRWGLKRRLEMAQKAAEAREAELLAELKRGDRNIRLQLERALDRAKRLDLEVRALRAELARRESAASALAATKGGFNLKVAKQLLSRAEGKGIKRQWMPAVRFAIAAIEEWGSR